MNFTKKKVFSSIAIVFCASCVSGGVLLRVFHKPTMVEQGWEVVGCLKNRDSQALASLLSPEELNLLGLTREQARRLLDVSIMPEAGVFADKVTAITIEGNGVALEKPKGDPEYYDPPNLILPRVGHDHFISLEYLFISAWGQRKKDLILQGAPTSEYQRYMLDEFRVLKGLGYTKTINPETHEVHPLPDRPVGV
jgi:hypothetical protein